jgi:4-hydroxybenzoate polyprenyltransferase
MSPTRVLLGLGRACHPGPTFVVTIAVTALAASLGRSGLGIVAVALAVLLGQLSVGWSNDALDAQLDAEAERDGKPIVAGLLSARTVRIAAGVAALVCIPMSFVAAGRIGGSAHLVGVASAWIYNLWLKKTLFSPLPYVISFALVAPFITYGLDPSQPPAPWFIATLACLGLAAGMANGIPDIESDRGVRISGLVARLGARYSAIVSALGVIAATALLVPRLQLSALVSVAIVVAATSFTIVAAFIADGRHLFRVVMLLALIDTALLCALDVSAVVR